MMYEVSIKWPVKYWWIDTDPTSPIDNNLFYHAVKTANPRTLITYNSYATSGFIGYPYDIKSIEYYSSPANGNAIYNIIQNGYYIPKEIISTVLTNEQYYYTNPDYLYDQPPYTAGTLQSQATIQSIYDKAKINGANCTLSVYADKNGLIPQGQVDLLSNITL